MVQVRQYNKDWCVYSFPILLDSLYFFAHVLRFAFGIDLFMRRVQYPGRCRCRVRLFARMGEGLVPTRALVIEEQDRAHLPRLS